MTHILITGASSGIGAALARLYAAPGMRLTLHGRSADRLQAIAAELAAKNAIVRVALGDVGDAAAMARLIAEADQSEPLDLIIANAGISRGSATDVADRQSSQQLFLTNWNGVLNTIHPAIDLMLPRRRGQIAIVSSLAGYRGFAGSAAYGASKAAVRVYGEALRAELAPHGVRLNVICPGFVKTPMTDVNPFPMPFLMDAARAAGIIREGLQRNRAIIAFPRPMYLLVRFIAMLPLDAVIRLMRDRPRKPPFDAG